MYLHRCALQPLQVTPVNVNLGCSGSKGLAGGRGSCPLYRAVICDTTLLPIPTHRCMDVLQETFFLFFCLFLFLFCVCLLCLGFFSMWGRTIRIPACVAASIPMGTHTSAHLWPAAYRSPLPQNQMLGTLPAALSFCWKNTLILSISNLFSISWSSLILLNSVLSYLLSLYFYPSFTILFSKHFSSILRCSTHYLSFKYTIRKISQPMSHQESQRSSRFENITSAKQFLPTLPILVKRRKYTNGIWDPYSLACRHLVEMHNHDLYVATLTPVIQTNLWNLGTVLHTW